MNSFVVAKVITANQEGKMLVLRRSKTDIRRPGQWDFAGGHVDEGEDIMAAARREALEETGLELNELQLVFAMSEIVPVHGAGTWLVFIAHTAELPEVKLSHEHDEYAWKTPEEFLQLATYDRQIKMVEYVAKNDLLKR